MYIDILAHETPHWGIIDAKWYMKPGKKEQAMSKVTLTMTPLRFYCTHKDEEMFFQWLDSISCVRSYEGVGKSLYVTLTTDVVSRQNFLLLKGLFKRYGHDTDQLSKLSIAESE